MIIDGTTEAFNRYALATLEPGKIKAGIKQKQDIAIKSYLPFEHKVVLNQVIRHYQQWYVEKDLERKQFEPLFENIKPVLEILHKDGWCLGIAPNRSLGGLNRGLLHHEIEKFFQL